MKTEIDPGYKLIETASLIKFKVISQDIQPTINDEDLHVEVDLQIIDEDGNPSEDDVEWGAFGFIFVIAMLSFADAKPRNLSSIDYKQKDEFSVGHLFDCLEFANGELKFYADYINGRCLKTRIVVRKDGSVSLETTNRGKALLHWLDRLKGKGKLKAI